MEETKVYVDELPKTCWDCSCQIDKYCGVLKCDVSDEMFDNIKYKYCPLIDIRDHDRELVKKVCGKINEWLKQNLIVIGGKSTELDVEYVKGYNVCRKEINELLDQIQKE